MYSSLLSSTQNAQRKQDTYTRVKQTLENKLSENTGGLRQTPWRFDLTSGSHTSKSDPTPHYLVDAYEKTSEGEEIPLGIIHVYEDGRTKSIDHFPNKFMDKTV
ncbi:hypothetical protein Clacol_010337 [Clathrus columnatus]|uniref:Uncharacterized protein n=1 Tax=Clathrus columnatus TaxID=1419009 RepID=A0AAV5ASS2_9AGAM|nr:hypothetical protein Clacol_010337 [Clathrus columnatus]